MHAESLVRRLGWRWMGSHPFQPLVLALSLVPLCAFGVAVAGIWRYAAQERNLGWSASFSDPAVVGTVEQGGPAAGRLRPGDRVVAMDGDSRVAVLGTLWKRRFLQPGHPYTLDIVRDGAPHHLSLDWSLEESNRQWALSVWLMVGLVWSGFGLFIGLARPSLPGARLWALAALSVGLNFIRMAMRQLLSQLEPASAALCGVLELNEPLVVPLVYHAMYRFPPSAPAGRIWGAALIGAYAAAIVGILNALSEAARYALDADRASAIVGAVNGLGISAGVLDGREVGTLILAAAVALRNFRRVDSADERRRVRWIIAALAVAVVPEIIAELVRGRTLEVLAALCSVVVPAAFTYAIVRHRVFEIAVAIRIGIQYLLARNALRIVIGLPIVAMVYLVASRPNLTVRQLALEYPAYPVLAATAAGTLAFRRRLTVTIDRRFFREAYDRERLLESLLDDVDSLHLDEERLQRIADRLEAALHPTTLLVWFHEHDRECMRVSVSRSAIVESNGDPWLLPPGLVHELEHEAAAVHVGASQGIETDTQRRLARFGIEVLVPMVGHDGRLRGLLGLGPKRGDEPYTPPDVQLLERIARQLAVVKEHIELRARVTKEQLVRQDVLGHLAGTGVDLLKECPTCGACYESGRQRCEHDGRELVLSLPVERTIAGRYRLDRLIGRGGMGAVYEAFDLSLRRLVAVKIILGRNFGNDAALRRFDREARAVARLNHPNIVAIFDYGHLSGEGAYLVMEHINGRTLRGELAAQTAYPPPESGDWIAQILDGVAAAHAHGVIHRDLKPENVLVTIGPAEPVRIKLLDFGLARLRASADDDTLNTSAPGLILGTLAYMAPEQLLGQPVDQRADIFALGVIVIEILTGERPFSADPLRRLRDVEHGVASRIISNEHARGLLGRCVAIDPNDRYPTVDAARSDLLAAVRVCAERVNAPGPHLNEERTS